MTKEEAVARIKDHMSVHKIYEERAVKITEALNMAIKALEQPERHWIPCRERLPGGWQWFYATCRSKVDDRENWVIEGLSSPCKLWGDLPPMVKEGDAEIIAWMPKEFPEPYREEGEK